MDQSDTSHGVPSLINSQLGVCMKNKRGGVILHPSEGSPISTEWCHTIKRTPAHTKHEPMHPICTEVIPFYAQFSAFARIQGSTFRKRLFYPIGKSIAFSSHHITWPLGTVRFFGAVKFLRALKGKIQHIFHTGLKKKVFHIFHLNFFHQLFKKIKMAPAVSIWVLLTKLFSS